MLEEKRADIDKRFRHHSPPRPEDGDKLRAIRQDVQATANFLVEMCPAGRELSLALTKLEEAMFWANASIARTWP